MESFSCLSTSSTRITPIQYKPTKEQSPFLTLFHLDEDILETMTVPDYPWDAMHHRSLFLPKKTVSPDKITKPEIYVIESKYFLPSGKFDWFKNPFLAPDVFEEGNMSNISPTIKVNISQNPAKVEEISLGVAFSPEEITSYTKFLQEYRDIFAWDYSEILELSPTIVEHHIDTWPDVPQVCQKQCQLHPSKAEAIKQEIEKLHKASFI